jgi:hypothetical protein
MEKIKIPKFIVFIALSVLIISNVNGQTYIYENFESGVKPVNWTYIKYSTTEEWQYLDGGYSTTGVPGTGHPQYSKEGLVNAMFHLESFSGQRVKLVTPPIDLAYGIKPELKFWHTQDERYTFSQWRNDELRVFYREHVDSAWKQLAEYTEKVSVWTERTIQLPDSTLSGTYYLAFEGKTNNGYGVCIDSVILVEKGVIPKYIEKVDVFQASTEFVATESKNNPILRVDITVRGNDGILKLDSLAVKSLNTDDSDISTNGVKLFASNDNILSNSVQVGSGLNFVNGSLSFVNINRTLPTGLSSLWITYDIASDISHDKHENILDAEIKKENIKINSNYYPVIDRSPVGSRVMYESILFDDFEADKGWTFTGEFQRAIPLGLGGTTKGSPDPDYAVSGDYIIGTDLTGLGTTLGDYENNLGDRAYVATTPYRSCKYYKDIYLYFDRWFNFDTYDTATIDFNTRTANNWNKYWQSSGTSINNEWVVTKYNVNSELNRQDSVRIRFTVGPTNSFWNYSGWNIDNVVLVGNFISKDVGVTNWITPVDGCGHTSTEYVTVTIKNYAGLPMTDPLPVSFSFNGGTTVYYDTIHTTIPIDGTLNYTIDKPVNLTAPGWYNNVYATTHLAGDEDATNDKFNKIIFIAPTYTLPYNQNFETNYGYYRTGGTNSSWAYGTPSGTVINSAASGTKAWVTSLSSNYNNAENSYLESPCFNFAGIDYPVFEFKSKGLSEDKIDGMALYYSIDDGDSWNIAPNYNNYNWSWYNETNISALATAGIDSTDNTWKTFRQLLPIAARNQSSVKFRFIFKSNESSNYEGFGFDDIRIYDAPGDVGVTAITYPITKCNLSDTTHLKVNIKNFGLDTLKTGTKIPVGYKFNNGATKRDTLVLASSLIPNATRNFTFNSTVDMSYAGDYTFAVFTTLEANPYLYSTICNDTVRDTISVIGMPRYDIGNIMGTPAPIDTFIQAGTGYSNYVWTGGGTNDITPPVDTLYVTTEGWYKVTVTNGVGCTAKDSVRVVPSLVDLKMDSLYTVVKDSCERLALTEIKVHVINKGLDDFIIGDTIYFGYKVNNNPIVYDTLKLTELFANASPDDTAYFTFAEKADFRTPGQYTLSVFTNFPIDLTPSDDTLTRVFNTWGFPDVELAYDSITSSHADTLLLIATPGYNTYSWNTSPVQTNDTLVPTNVSRWYVVTVTDIHSCGTDKDSTYINTYDYGITRVVAPVNACSHLAANPIQLNVFNHSGNNYLIGDSIKFKYNFNNAGWISQKHILTSAFAPNDSMKITLPNTINISAIDDYTLSVCIDAKMDANHTNDTVHHSFATWGYPNVELTYDTIFTTQADTVILVATPGYNAYLWNDASTNDSLVVTQNYSQKFVVTVSDIHGCGSDKDSTQIITYDLGISAITNPKNACKHISNEAIRVTVKNFSNDTILAGTPINVGYIFNGNSAVVESTTIPVDLYPTKTFVYQFLSKINLEAIGSYNLKVFTDFKNDVVSENDTLVDIIKTYGYPSVEIGPDIYTFEPDTVVLVATPGYNFYSWNEGTKNDSLIVTKPESFEYVVTVTSIDGCSTNDTLTVYTTNISASALVAPISKCELTNSEIVTVTVLNNCYDTIAAGESITVSYRLSTGSLVTENHVLTADLLPNGTVNHSFATPIDLSVYQNYNFRVFAKSSIDVNTNDTTSVTVEFRRPNLDLGPDVNTTLGAYTIDAGAGYTSYLWFDSSTGQTYTVNVNNQRANFYYPVTVTNSYGCLATDSVLVSFNVSPDLSVSALVSPVSACLSSTLQNIDVEITNSGGLDIAAGNTIAVSYKIDNASAITENHVLAAALFAGGKVVHRFAGQTTFTTAKAYQFKSYLAYAGDVTRNNDTLVSTVTMSAPSFSFSSDTIKVSVFPYVLDAGSWTTYLWQNGSTGRQFSVTANGWYKVRVTDAGGCAATDSVYIRLVTGIDRIIHGADFMLSYYPNPVQDLLSIDIEAYKPIDILIDLSNTQGQIIYTKQIKNAEQLVEKLYVGDFAKGVYYIRFTIGKESFVRKVVIQ